MLYEQDIIDTNKIDIEQLFSVGQVFNVICYHINDKSGLYPFIQFLLVNDLRSNRFVMPRSSKEDLVYNIKNALLSMGIMEEYIDEDKIVFKGYYKDKVKRSLDNNLLIEQTFSLLVDVSGIDLSKLLLVRANPAWFALYTEIVNEKHICNISISKNVTSFFEANPCLAKIYSDNSNKMIYYPIPRVAYTGDKFKRVEFKGLFGEQPAQEDIDYNNKIFNCDRDFYCFESNTKIPIYFNKKNYYYFESNFNEAVKSIFYSKNNNNDKYGINRYAFFNEKTKFLEDLLVDLDLELYDTNYFEGSIIATQYEQHVPISYHILDNKYLADSQEWLPNKNYCII